MEDSGSLAQRVWPTLEELAQPARERKRLDPALRDRLILELCATAPLSVRELAQLLSRTEAYTGDAIRPLVDSGQLLFLFPGQPRHPRQKYLTRSSPLAGPLVANADPSAVVLLDGVRGAEGSAPDRRIAEGWDGKEELAPQIWPQLEAIALPATERKRLTPEVRDRLVLELCWKAPLSTKDLAALLSRNEAYVGDAIHPLLDDGRLIFLYPDQPRHPRQKYVTSPAAAGEFLGTDGATVYPVSDTDSEPQTLAQRAAYAQTIWQELEQAARRAREHRAMDSAALADLIASLCSRAPLSARELAILLDRREDETRQLLHPLLNAGRLSFLYKDEPGHPRQKYLASQPSEGWTTASHTEQPVPGRPLPPPAATNVIPTQPALIPRPLQPMAAPPEPAALAGRRPDATDLSAATAPSAPVPLPLAPAPSPLAPVPLPLAPVPLPLAPVPLPLAPAPPPLATVPSPPPPAPSPNPVEDIEIEGMDISHIVADAEVPADRTLVDPVLRVDPSRPRKLEGVRAAASTANEAVIPNAVAVTTELAAAEEAAETPSRVRSLLTRRSSPLVALALGVIMGFAQPVRWPEFTVVAAIVLAVFHVATNSPQFRHYKVLNPSRARLLSFLLLKAGVAAAEILIGFGAVRLVLSLI